MGLTLSCHRRPWLHPLSSQTFQIWRDLPTGAPHPEGSWWEGFADFTRNQEA